MIKNFLLILVFVMIAGIVPAQIKIMPLGNSITAGQFIAANPDDNNSYRRELLRLLRENNYNNTVFVGSNSCGDFDQRNNEGHSGWTIRELQNGRNGVGGVGAWIPASDPDIILLQIGTNDFNSVSPDLAKAVSDIDNLVNAIFKHKPTVKLVVASILPVWWNNNYFSYNKALINVVADYKATGKAIWFYDMHNCGLGIEGYRDRLHPNAENGYLKMANAWYGVTKFLLDSMTVNQYVTNPVVSNFSDRAIIRWHPSFAASEFNILSALSASGPYTTLALGVTENWVVDNISSDESRYYIIEGLTSSNRLIYSDTIKSTVSDSQNISINCGNGIAGSFIEDVLYTGGNMYWYYYSDVSKAFDESSIPDNVFKTARAGTFSYQFSNLISSNTYQLTLYFMEGDKTDSGQRIFDVTVNGTNILSSFDVFSAAGGKDKAIKREFTVMPSNGNILLEFKSKADSAIINGISLVYQ